jgi:hypothetical protein
MTLSEYVAPVLATGGPVALLAVVLCFGPNALVRLVAGTVAVLTGDKERSERCIQVLRVLRGREDPPTPSAGQRPFPGKPAADHKQPAI